MLRSALLLARKLFSSDINLSEDDVAEARQYIKEYWPRLTRFNPKDTDSLIGLPNKYLVPAHEEGHEFDFNEMYYWDSYFMVQGLLNEKHKELVLGILDNLIYMLDKFNVIPNASRTYLMGRSQPPLLTSLIWDIYEAYNFDTKWLGEKLKFAQFEYETVWRGTKKPHARLVYEGLSRYYDINLTHDLAETESGWDYTPRFNRKSLNYLPVDLNSLLFKYEMDFARYYRLINRDALAIKWEAKAHHRAKTMRNLMWDKVRNLFYDYNFVKEKRGTISSMAGLFPLWASMLDENTAAQVVKTGLARFESRGGLATTDTQPLSQFVPGAIPTQWAHPNGWAPLHFMIVKGLENYGFHDDARRIAMKWLKTNLVWFNNHHEFLEKYNVVSPDKPPAKGVYPSQTGFGWTNSIFEYFCQKYIDNK